MITLYLTSKMKNISATGEYNSATKQFTVLKGSRVSDSISQSTTFSGRRTVEKNRRNTVIDCIVVKDITFKSASNAANFVTGYCTNGLIAWKNKEGQTLREINNREIK